MEDGWQQWQSKRKHSVPGFFPAKAHNLSSLLEEEWFLLMVLEHVVDHGLYNCRLVCWKWYELCQRFPIKLAQIAHKHLKEAADAFPNTISMSMKNVNIDETSDDTFFEPLAALSSLKSLKFLANAVAVNLDAPLNFRSIPQLNQLDLTFNRSNGAEELVSSLRYLTALTKLTLVGGYWEHHQIDPFFELQSIRELEIELDLFTDPHGNCFFPSLTNLTRLDLKAGWRDEEDEGSILTTEAVSLYASSLQYLNLTICADDLAFSFAALTTLTELKTLELGCTCIFIEGSWEAFEELHSVTRLCAPFCAHVDEIMLESIPLLTELKALDFPNVLMHDYEAADIPLAPKMTQLTELSITVNGTLIPKLNCLTRLVHLKLTVQSNNSCSLDDALSCMPHLQTLGVKLIADVFGYGEVIVGTVRLSSDSLTETSQLESVSLDLVDVDKDFFGQLASKVKLTKLEFSSAAKKVYPRSLLSQINQLRHLEELKLRLADQCHICEILSPQHLSKLKKLTVECSAQQEEALRRRFAHRREVRINHKDSPWQRHLSL